VDAEVQALCELPDPKERAVRASELSVQYQAAVNELSRVRREALEELVAQGMTQGQIADLLKMTRSRVGQLLAAGPRSERAFLGTGELTVALGGKLESGKATPGPVLAQEDFAAYGHLQELAETVNLKTRYEIIPPPGMVNLNRENLIVVCGPRLSPLVGQVLASDDHISFGNDDSGWHLIDKHDGKIYRSPIDSGESGDFAYLGRLPRLDGKGGFLYMAGIHAVGAAGAIHYLSEHMADAYREVKTRRFSTIIRCTFDPKTREVTSSERVTPFYRQDGI
jgi:hypothetical protein